MTTALSMKVSRHHGQPVHRQIADSLREAVTAGQIRPGERLPSARSLAVQLGVARGTVDAAYASLAGEGFLVARGAGGTVVAPGLPTLGVPVPPLVKRPPSDPATGPTAGMESALAFRVCLPAFDAFPRTLWARLVARRARALSTAGLVYPDPLGVPALRHAIAAYLAVARGIACRAEQVIVTGGYQGALGLVAAALLKPGNPVWCEDPGYAMAREALAVAGATVVPVPVDGQGLRVEAGVERSPEARLAVVTPSHQSPLGVAMALPRRLALLDWAAEADAFVIEDDYDSEFRYAGRPLPALKSLDRAGRVLYAGTFSKVLYPGLRLGYLVVPEAVLDRFASSCRALNLGLPVLEQAVVAEAMTEGHFGRHLKRMRNLYASRRTALAAALDEALGSRIALALGAGGMHLLARFPGYRGSDTVLAAAANRHGLWPAPLSASAVEVVGEPGLLIGFTNTPETGARRAAATLANAIGTLVA